MTFRDLLGKPSAFLPLVLSVLALAFLLGYVGIVGVEQAPGSDEGAPARLFQLVMALQLVVMALFAVRWLPVSFRPALLVLALQVAAAAVPVVTVVLFETLM